MRALDRRMYLATCLVVLLAPVALVVPAAGASVATWTSQDDYQSGTLFDLDASLEPGNLVLARNVSLWEKFGESPLFAPGPEGAWDESSVNQVHVLYDAGVHRMWYSGCSGTSCSIGIATSSDGLSWIRHAGNPVLPRDPSGWDETIGNPYVIKDGDVYRMWFAGNSVAGTIEIGYATSIDGHSWTKHPGNPVLRPTEGAWDQGSISTPAVIREGSLFTIWYSGQAGDFIYRMGRATSPDGVSWTKDPSNPILSPELPWEETRVHPVQILKSGGRYELYYTAGFSTYHVGHLVSADGTMWTREPASPVLSPGSTGSWDSWRLGSVTVLAFGTQRKMWYIGGAQFQPLGLSVGLATTPHHELMGTFVSDVFDSRDNLSVWQGLTWSATVPLGASLTVTSRSGNGSVPDATWSAWSSPASSSPVSLELPPSRYVQVKVVFLTTDSLETPVLSVISVSFAGPTSGFPTLAFALIVALVPVAVAVPLVYFAYRWRRGQPQSPRGTARGPSSPPVPRCRNCGHVNSAPSRFCSQCGEALP